MKAAGVLLATVFVFAITGANAQKLVFVFGHAGYASSVGKLRDANISGAIVEAGAGVGMGKTFVTGTTGFTWFASNRRPGSTSKGGLRYTPVTLGLRRYLLLKNLFVKGDAGFASMKLIDTDIKSTQLTTSIGAGLKFTTFEAIVDYNTAYGGYGSWFGLKIGFALGL